MVDLTSKIIPRDNPDQPPGFRSALIVLAAALCVLGLWTAFEYAFWSMAVLPNKAPDLVFYAFGRSAVTALISFAVLNAFAGGRKAPTGTPLAVGQMAAVALSLVLLVVFLAIFLLSPAAFSRMSLEDGFVEWASALLPIAASFLLIWCWGRIVTRGGKAISWIGVALLFSAALLFALGMEEISWMQRIFGFHTPEALSGNIQHELNLHNLATNQIGTLHKLVGFVFLIFLPFVQATMPQAVRIAGLDPLIPSRCVALVAAPLAALNYNGWDLLAMQMTTYLTIGIVVYFARRAWRDNRSAEAILCLGLVIAIIVAQSLFIAFGDRFERIWDITEYKELFIACGLFVWAVELFTCRKMENSKEPY